MNSKALGWLVTGGMMFASTLTAQPLNDLQARLATLRSDQPVRVKVDVEMRHKGSAPLHWNRTKERGEAIVIYGRFGPEVRQQKWLTTGGGFSVWGKSKNQNETSLVDETEAGDLVDPAGMMELFLQNATLLSDEEVSWQGRPARLLVIRPNLLAKENEETEAGTENEPKRFLLEAKIWLDADGSPLALERSVELRFGPALKVVQHQAITLQQVNGRLLAARSDSTYSGTALAVLKSRNEKKMTVTAVN